MKKKLISMLAIAQLGLTSLGAVDVATSQPVQASFASKYHLRAYVIPNRFRGTWYAHRGHKRLKLRITRRTIRGPWDNSKMVTYRTGKKIVPYKNRIYTVSKWGRKGIQYSVPQTCAGGAMRRRGSKLVFHQLMSNIIFHR